jgi:hypothetical protein
MAFWARTQVQRRVKRSRGRQRVIMAGTLVWECNIKLGRSLKVIFKSRGIIIGKILLLAEALLPP